MDYHHTYYNIYPMPNFTNSGIPGSIRLYENMPVATPSFMITNINLSLTRSPCKLCNVTTMPFVYSVTCTWS